MSQSSSRVSNPADLDSSQGTDFAFPLDSEMWRINHQRCGLIFGPAAAILQIAHPRLAQGVADHSDFQNDTLGRLRRTLSATNGIAFGTVEEAEAIRDRMRQVHSKVKGRISPGIRGPAGYSAFEPDLQLWVLATMVMAAVQGWEMVYGTLPDSRREDFYRDMCEFGTFFGVPADSGPRDWRELMDYYAEVISSDELGSHPICAELCRQIMSPPDSIGTRILGWCTRFAVIETIPRALHEKLEIRSTLMTRLQMKLLRKVVPRVFLRLPQSWRVFPEALVRLGREN